VPGTNSDARGSQCNDAGIKGLYRKHELKTWDDYGRIQETKGPKRKWITKMEEMIICMGKGDKELQKSGKR
jgi:hypothetical protein